MSGKKLPAYARKLLSRRRGGSAGIVVDLVFGSDWTRPPPDWRCRQTGGTDLLAVSPADYLPGVYDLRVCAGMHVFLADRAEPWHVHDDYPSWMWLAGEVATVAACVWWRSTDPVYANQRDPRVDWELIDTLAAAYYLDGGWPAWWPPHMRMAHDRRAA